MAYWETAPLDGSVPVVLRDFTRIWRAAEKVVYSRVLESVSSTKTRIERVNGQVAVPAGGHEESPPLWL